MTAILVRLVSQHHLQMRELEFLTRSGHGDVVGVDAWIPDVGIIPV